MMMERTPEFVTLTEYIQDVLYFGTVRPGRTLKCTEYAHYFCIDEKLIYENYYSDFGPLNISCVYKYCKMLNEKLKNFYNRQKIVHYASNDAKKRSNAAFLLGCYGVLYLHLSPQEAIKPLILNGLTFRTFQDAVQGDSCYTISILDCLNGIKKAKERGFINFQDFNYKEYDRLDKIQGGDVNWIVPGKYLAFIGPVDYNYGVSLYHPPEIYIDYFLENNVSIVIRLNKKFYDPRAFTNVGIYHYDLFFPDGSCPPRHILLKFLQISEDNPDCAIAVHCKAGLGRTGSLIGCYLIKHYRMTAREAIAWMRICRPGSVIGHQQGWLEQLEPWLLKQGQCFRKRMYQNPDKFPYHEFGVYSFLERRSFNKTPPRSGRDSEYHSRSSSPVNLQRLPTPISVHTTTSTAPSARTCVLLKTPESTSTTARGADFKCQTDSRLDSLSRWKLYSKQRDNMTPTESNHLHRRMPDAGGDPRNSHQPRPRRVNAEDQQRRRSRVYTVATTMRNIQPTNANDNEDSKNTFVRSPFQLKNGEHKRFRKTLESTIKAPQEPTASSFIVDNLTACIEKTSKFAYAAPLCLSTNRSRLGRSPSPPVAGRLSQRSMKTSTHALLRDASKKSSIGSQKPSVLQKKLYKLQTGLYSSHERRPAAPSVGAGSLGARREAPPGITRETTLSARSDNRARATQGDLLNSIKFERRMREADSMKDNGARRSDPSNYKQFQEIKTIRPQLVKCETPGWQLPCDKEPPQLQLPLSSRRYINRS